MGKDYATARNELKSKLYDFLIDQGLKVNTSGKHKLFNCIQPDHTDKRPSMGVMTSSEGNQLYHCFSCGESGDIYKANHILNNAPLIGYEFVTKNLKPLADKFGIDFEPRPMTKEEIEEMNIRSVMAMAKDIISSTLMNGKVEKPVKDYMTEKELTQKANVAAYGLGTVRSWDSFISSLKQQGIEDSLIKKAGLRSNIFNENNLIFTLTDEYGNPKGFAGRNCIFSKEDPDAQKYYNSPATEYFNKSNILFNLHRAIKRTADKHNSLYIVEGYTDSTTLDKSGLRSTALCGTALTEDHISLLQRIGVTDIVLLLDGDNAGRKAAGKSITKLMEGVRNFRTRIVELPDGEDPDSFVRKFGVQALHELPHQTTFEWRLSELKEKSDLTDHELAKQVIPLIVNERSHIERDRMAEILANIVDIPLDTIRREILLIVNDKQMKAKAEKDAIVDNIVKKLKKDPNDALIILTEAQRAIKNVSERNNEFVYDEREVLESLNWQEINGENEELRDSIYFRRMPRFEKQIDGQISGKLMLLGGQPNAGKSSFVLNLIVNILKAEAGDSKYDQALGDLERYNNVCIILHSVDDSRKDIVDRLVTILTYEKYRRIYINLAAAPYKFKGDPDQYGLFMQARKEAYQELKSWVADGRLIIKDSTHGTTLSSSMMMVEHAKQKFSGRKILYFLDNLYDLSDFPNIAEETKRLQELSRALKLITVQQDILTFSTVEYRKGNEGNRGHQSQNESISGPKTLEYDANWIGHLLNDLHTNPQSTEWYFSEKTYNDWNVPQNEKLPIITLQVGKNKITDVKGDLHYYFLPSKALFLEVHKNNLGMIRPQIRQKLENIYGRTENVFPFKTEAA